MKDGDKNKFIIVKSALPPQTPETVLMQLKNSYFCMGRANGKHRISETIEIIIEALVKQIPTNVKNKTLEYDGEYADCPNCGALVCEYRNFKRCPECGQAITWK